MITTEQKKIFKAVVGKNHIQKLMKHFESIGLESREGGPYSYRYIVNIWNGNLENPKIEALIWRFVQDTAKKIKEQEAEKAEMLKKIKETIETTPIKNPGVAAPGNN